MTRSYGAMPSRIRKSPLQVVTSLRFVVFCVAGVRDTMGAATRGELSSLLQKEPMELAMKCNDLSRSLVAFDQNSTLVAVVELSLNSWVAAGVVPGLGRDPVKESAALTSFSAIDPVSSPLSTLS